MTESASSEKLPSPKHYEKIGRFVVSFEKVINNSKNGVFTLLQEYKLEDDELALAVTADLNANHVFGIFRWHNPQTNFSNVSRALLKRTQPLLHRRNTLLHSCRSDEVPENEVFP